MSKRRQKLVFATIGLVQRIFQTFALRDIRRHANNAVWPAAGIEQRRPDRGVNVRSIALENVFLEFQGFAFSEDAAIVLIERRRSVDGQNIVCRTSTHLLVTLPKELLEPSIDMDETVSGV